MRQHQKILANPGELKESMEKPDGEELAGTASSSFIRVLSVFHPWLKFAHETKL
jgi:hypothetical protein